MALYIPAKTQLSGRARPLRVIVWHDMEAPEARDTAENVARWFGGPNAPRASAHVNADPDSVVESVKPQNTAAGAPGVNQDGYHIELAGYAKQTAAEWLDATSIATIKNAARWVAPIMKAYGIPARWLTDAELADGKTKGMTTHRQATRVFKIIGGHTDPGPNFPYDETLALVKSFLTATPTSVSVKFPLPKGNYFGVDDKTNASHSGIRGNDSRYVKMIQKVVGASQDGIFGPKTKAAVIKWQKAHKIDADGEVGPITWDKMF